MKHILQKYKPQIDLRIKALCISTNGSNIPWATDISKRLADFSVLGKSVRGSMFLYTCELFDYDIDDVAIDIAASLELLHSALLIHDDIIDHDQIRRGTPSMHAQYEAWGTDHGVIHVKKFGEGMALCVGDIAIFGAFSHLSELALPPAIHMRILKLMLREFLTVGFGELHDTALGYLPTMPTPEEVLSMYHKKTARYTFSLPFMLGCILSQQSTSITKTMELLGENLGYIFQLQDDLLTFSGNEQIVGKTIGNDIRENKKTYIAVFLWNTVVPEEKTNLHRIFGNPNITQQDIDYIRNLVAKYNILSLVQNQITTYELEAQKLIDTLSVSQDSQRELRGILTFLKDRQS